MNGKISNVSQTRPTFKLVGTSIEYIYTLMNKTNTKMYEIILKFKPEFVRTCCGTVMLVYSGMSQVLGRCQTPLLVADRSVV